MLAFSTSSSAATLPVTMECVEDNLGVKNEVASFVLPLGATINLDGTALYQAVATVFIAQALGMELDLAAQLTIVLTALLASIGTAPVPAAGIIMLVIVLESVGVPSSGIALILGVDRILDMVRTATNVTGDSAVTVLIDAAETKWAEKNTAAVTHDSISFKVYVSFDQIGSTPLANLNYDDIGLAFYLKDPFDDALEFLIDNGLKLQGASAVKIVFTVAGSANDSSYSIKATLVKSDRVLCGRC